MASDDDYITFLENANQDLSAGVKSAEAGTGAKGGRFQFKTVDHDVEVPPELKDPTERGEWVYMSDADEPFEPVALKIEGQKLPDEETFARLIMHPNPEGDDITIHDVVEWDSAGQYKHVVDATRKACKGCDIRVYRVQSTSVRVEYFIVGVNPEGGKLVGVKALAIES